MGECKLREEVLGVEYRDKMEGLEVEYTDKVEGMGIERDAERDVDTCLVMDSYPSESVDVVLDILAAALDC